MDVRLAALLSRTHGHQGQAGQDEEEVRRHEAQPRGSRHRRDQHRRREALGRQVPEPDHLRLHVQAQHGVHERTGTHRARRAVRPEG